MINQMINKKKKKKGFTLVELVAVVAIIGILAAILVPKVTSYMNEAKKVKVIDPGRKVITAIESYDMKNDSTVKTTEAGTNVSTLLGKANYAAIKEFVTGGDATNKEYDKIEKATVEQIYSIVEEKADFKIDSKGAFESMVK